MLFVLGCAGAFSACSSEVIEPANAGGTSEGGTGAAFSSSSGGGFGGAAAQSSQVGAGGLGGHGGGTELLDGGGSTEDGASSDGGGPSGCPESMPKAGDPCEKLDLVCSYPGFCHTFTCYPGGWVPPPC